MVEQGTAVDATIIQAPTGHPRKHDDLESSKDEAATHIRKHGRFYHGYKAHVATDNHALITNYLLDTAKVHDINHFEQLLRVGKDPVFADSAYRDTERRKRLADRGLVAGRDLALVAVNDEGLARFMVPSITSLVMPDCHHLVRAGLEWITQPDQPGWTQPLLLKPTECKLFLGESSGVA